MVNENGSIAISNQTANSTTDLPAAAPSFWVKHGLFIAVLLAFIGCFIGFALTYSGRLYHELVWKPDVVLEAVCTNTDTFYHRKLQTRITAFSEGEDTSAIAKYWVGKFAVNEEKLPAIMTFLKGKMQTPIPVIYKDTGAVKKRLYANVIPAVKTYSNEDFFAKYPAFGFWALLIIIQLSLYFYLFPLALTMVFGKSEMNDWRSLDNKDKIMRVAYSIILLVLLIVFFSLALYTSESAKPAYFMESLSNVLKLTNILGYILVGFLLCSVLLPINKVKENAVAINEVIKMERRINNLFLITALILSLAVLATGSLFSGLNSLAFIKQLKLDLGYTPFSNDTVYLYGLLHSFVLSLFFLPARTTIADVKAALLPPATGDNPTSTNPLGKIVREPMKKFFEVVVASTPLLASLFQAIFDSIVN